VDECKPLVLGCFLSGFTANSDKSYSVTVTACDPCGSQSSNAKLEGMSGQARWFGSSEQALHRRRISSCSVAPLVCMSIHV
jgi:hypothetical protein